MDPRQVLQILQLADSAVPIGAAAHSFGLETLTADETLTAADLEAFLRGYLSEAGLLEAAFCRAAYGTARPHAPERFLALNLRLSALKPARESRTASATLGRRFLQMVLNLEDCPMVRDALGAARRASADIHYCTAFGFAGGALNWEEEAAVLAYLQQALMGLVSACQRLLPLGQSQAGRMIWELQPLLTEIAERSRGFGDEAEEAVCFTPLLDIAAMRHPALTTRLFIS